MIQSDSQAGVLHVNIQMKIFITYSLANMRVEKDGSLK
jgi:hypothetical protein